MFNIQIRIYSSVSITAMGYLYELSTLISKTCYFADYSGLEISLQVTTNRQRMASVIVSHG